jgi:hypothetical protein
LEGQREQPLLQPRQPPLRRADQILHRRAEPRISASTASVGIPRSISQVRRALPYCR